MSDLTSFLQNDTILAAAVFIGAVAFVSFLAMIASSSKPVEEPAAEADDLGFGRSRQKADHYSFHEDWDELLAESNQASVSKYLLPTEKKERKKLGERLMHAGMYRKNTVIIFSLMKLVLSGVAILFGFAAASAGLMETRNGLMAGAAAALFGTIGPSFWLDHCKKQRQIEIKRALPDALDVIIICAEAGLSMPAAFQKVATELGTAHPLLASEFVITQREIQMGCTTGEALRRFAGRFDLEELRTLATVILQTEKFGASVVKALRVHAETLRLKRLYEAEEKAQKAVVKLLFPTALFIFPSLFVVVLGPAAFDIAEALNKF